MQIPQFVCLPFTLYNNGKSPEPAASLHLTSLHVHLW